MYPTYPIPEPPTADLSREPRRRDPLAVALANASLLGVGYLLLGRRVLAVFCSAISVALIVVLGTVEHSGWLQYVLLAWWAAAVLHGWFLASRTAGPAEKVRQHRIVAIVVAVSVLATLVLFRFDVNGEADAADAAHQEGECGLVLSVVSGIGFWQRVGDAPVADGMLDSAEACRVVERARRQAENDRELAAATIAEYEELPAARWKGAHEYRADLLLDQAADDLREALRRDMVALEDGFGLLARVRGEFPERHGDVRAVLDDFLARLGVQDACVTVDVTDWIGEQETRDAELDRAAEVVSEVAPTALVTCADHLLANKNSTAARARYQQLTTEYPSNPLVPRAKRGVTLATYAIQLANVRGLLRTTGPNQRPAYCRNPAPYGAAKPYRGRGPHRALVYGQDYQRNSLPAGWRATDPANATLIVCAGEVSFGDVVETCPYTGSNTVGVSYISFRKRKNRVRVFELRTGRMVANTAVQISGASCPNTIYVFGSAPRNRYVAPSTANIRDAFRFVIRP